MEKIPHQLTILLKNGTIVNADTTFISDVLIKDGLIAAIGPNLQSQGQHVRVIDIKGFYVMPGGIDPHTHLDFEFMGTKTIDDFYTGTKAAIKGGTTTIIDFIDPRKGESLLSAYDRYVEKAEGNAVCNYGFHMIIREWNKRIADEMSIIATERSINSFKMFLAYKDTYMMSDSELYQIFMKCKALGALPLVHGENGSIIAENSKKLIENGITGPEGHTLSRPADVEAEATNRSCVIATEVGCPLYVVHVMSDSAANIVALTNTEGKIQVFGETLCAALGSNGAPDGCDFRTGAAYVMSPPIRKDPMNKIHLMNRLAKGDLVCTASDHCTFTCAQKEKLGKDCFTQIPSGVNGVEDRMSVIWENGVNKKILTLCDFVAVTSTNAAKIFNVYPKKGIIAVGSDADIVVWNPSKQKTISSATHEQAVDFNIFEGMKITGGPEMVLVGGKVCLEHGELKITRGSGNYLPKPCFSEMAYRDIKNLIKKN